MSKHKDDSIIKQQYMVVVHGPARPAAGNQSQEEEEEVESDVENDDSEDYVLSDDHPTPSEAQFMGENYSFIK